MKIPRIKKRKPHIFISGIEYKECTCCKINKLLSEFRTDNHKWDKATIYCRLCLDIRYKNFRVRNKEKLTIKRIANYQKNKAKLNKERAVRQNKQRKCSIKHRLVDNLRSRIRTAVIKGYKSARTEELLGCTLDQFKQYLEQLFVEGMSWENYGFYGWHIDHIKPCSSFDLSREEDQRLCFHYTNLQPLWAKDNLKKGASFIEIGTNNDGED